MHIPIHSQRTPGGTHVTPSLMLVEFPRLMEILPDVRFLDLGHDLAISNPKDEALKLSPVTIPMLRAAAAGAIVPPAENLWTEFELGAEDEHLGERLRIGIYSERVSCDDIAKAAPRLFDKADTENGVGLFLLRAEERQKPAWRVAYAVVAMYHGESVLLGWFLASHAENGSVPEIKVFNTREDGIGFDWGAVESLTEIAKGIRFPRNVGTRKAIGLCLLARYWTALTKRGAGEILPQIPLPRVIPTDVELARRVNDDAEERGLISPSLVSRTGRP